MFITSVHGFGADHQSSASIECGESPYDVPFHKGPYAPDHIRMKTVFREMAAMKGSE